VDRISKTEKDLLAARGGRWTNSLEEKERDGNKTIEKKGILQVENGGGVS